MSDASDNFENDLSLLFFNATNWANVADNAVSTPISNWQLSLHTSSPGEAGNQTTNEIGYTNYARVAKARSGSGFTVTGGSTVLASNADFPAGGGGSGTATHLGLGNASSASGRLQLYGTISPSIICGSGITPRLTTATQFVIS